MTEERRWQEPGGSRQTARRLAASRGLPLPLGQLLVSRGIADDEAVERFLNPRLDDLSDPFSLPDMESAVRRLSDALARGERITVFGLSDCDAIAAVALLVSVLRQYDGEALTFLPRRYREGVGFTPKALNRCISEQQPDLLVTVDCGSCSVMTAELAHAQGVDVIVLDHHEITGPLAPVTALVNPQRSPDHDSEFLASAGVVLQLCQALRTVLAESELAQTPLAENQLLEWATLGTVSDVVPVLGHNRSLVKHGLACINRAPSVGMAALVRAADSHGEIGCSQLGFLIGPSLSSPGRMGRPRVALDLLLSRDRDASTALAAQVMTADSERKALESEVMAAAAQDVEHRFDAERSAGVVAAGKGWCPGAVDNVAARLFHRFGRPAAVVAFDDTGCGYGACHCPSGIPAARLLSHCRPLLGSFGGHMARGHFTLRSEQVGAFRKGFNEACRLERSSNPEPPLSVDAWISLKGADGALLHACECLQPFGPGNPTPLWGFRGVVPVGTPTIVGRNHLKLCVRQDGVEMPCIGFGLGDHDVPSGPLDLIAQLKCTTFRGHQSLTLNVRDLRAAQETTAGAVT